MTIGGGTEKGRWKSATAEGVSTMEMKTKKSADEDVDVDLKWMTSRNGECLAISTY